MTDEVIDSALRYRVQAPMIDSLMKEIGIEGGSLGRMTEVLRDAKDIEALKLGRAKGGKGARAKADGRAVTMIAEERAMAKVYSSIVIPAPVSAVWAVVRDFNGLPKWTPFVAESRIEQARRPTRSAASETSA